MRKIIAKDKMSKSSSRNRKRKTQKTPGEWRCNMCPDKVTEDEEHFSTKCESYGHLKI